MSESFTAKNPLSEAEPDLIDTPVVKETPATDEQLEQQWADPPGLFGRLMSVQNDTIGRRLILTGFFFLLLGGSVDSVLMRLQLAIPENNFLSPQLYNELFTNHGSVTMFLVILPITEGFAILILPFLLGSREMPFPRLGVFAFFTFLMGGLMYYSSTLFGLVPDAGWFAYTPLSGPEYSPSRAMDFWLLGLSVAEIGAISGGIEIIIAILKMRAPGMSLSRMPLFAWAMLVMAFMLLFAFTPLIVGSFLLELDRKFGTLFFNVQGGGSDLLWQHLFWIFGHPEVYIQFLPAVGVVSMVLPVFVRRPIAGYTWIAASFIAIGFLSFGLWAHHMFAAGLPPIVLNFFAAASMAIGIPAGVQIFAWLATLWTGRPIWKTPFMFVIGFLAIFVIGGITGIMTASVPLDLQVHDSYFVVAHLHYVLIGGVAFPIFAAAYYWLPKWIGRLLDERLGQLNFWLMFIGVNVTFFPMHIVGLLGMPRRVYTYPAGMGWDIYNLISTIGVFIIVLAIFTFVVNLIYSSRKGRPAGSNPWGADTLEWAVASPPPNYGFSVTPIIRSRHPLWEQNDLHRGDPRLVQFVHALASWPLKWRAALICGTMDGQPEEVFRVSGPSIWPFIAAVGTVIIFFSEIFDLHLLTGLGALVIVASLIAWHWPVKAPITEEEEASFEKAHGIDVHAGGSRAVARWGMGLVILIIGIALTSLLLTYFYLRLENNAWPPQNVTPPKWPFALASAGLMLISAVPLYLAWHGIRAGKQRHLKLGLIIAWLCAAAAVVLQVFAFRQEGFTWQTHAYASVFFVLGGFVLLITLIGLIIGAVVLFWAFRGSYSARRHVAIDNVLRFWVATIIVWLIGMGTLYLTPYVT